MVCKSEQDKHYWHVGIVQNSPRGEPAFYHRRSNCCKFWLQTAVDTWELPRTVTPPLSLPALQQSKDCRDLKGRQQPCLPTDKVIVPDEVKCQHIDLGSLLLLERHNQTRSSTRLTGPLELWLQTLSQLAWCHQRLHLHLTV